MPGKAYARNGSCSCLASGVSRCFATEKPTTEDLGYPLGRLQNSTEWRFETMRLSTEFTKALIAKARNEGTLPDLWDVSICTAVPSVAIPEKADALECLGSHLSACGARTGHSRHSTLTNYRRSHGQPPAVGPLAYRGASVLCRKAAIVVPAALSGYPACKQRQGCEWWSP